MQERLFALGVVVFALVGFSYATLMHLAARPKFGVEIPRSWVVSLALWRNCEACPSFLCALEHIYLNYLKLFKII